MCIAVEFDYETKNYTYYFDDLDATLPLLRKNGNIELFSWGRKKEQVGNLPLGSWVTEEAIGQDQWQKYNAKLVRIWVKKFAEKDIHGKTRWFELTKGQFILGLLARDKDEARVYTIALISQEKSNNYNRWPRILSQPCY